MNPRQARRERHEAERKAKKLELKKSRLLRNLPPGLPSPASLVAENDPTIQPRWNPELEDEFPREQQIRHNAIADRISLQTGLPIPPGPSPSFQDLFAKRNARNSPPAQSDQAGFVSQNQPAPSSRRLLAPHAATNRAVSNKAATNKANSQFSTGPRTTEGKLASYRNSTKHGLASGTLIIPGEDRVAFESLLNDLLAEHQPANPTEDVLVHEMAQSYWLTQRAIRFQNTCFTDEGVNEKQLALFLRYQSAHERRFYKALNCLLQLKKQAARLNRGFVSQQAASHANSNSQFARPNHPAGGFVPQTPPLPEENSRAEATRQAA